MTINIAQAVSISPVLFVTSSSSCRVRTNEVLLRGRRFRCRSGLSTPSADCLRIQFNTFLVRRCGRSWKKYQFGAGASSGWQGVMMIVKLACSFATNESRRPRADLPGCAGRTSNFPQFISNETFRKNNVDLHMVVSSQDEWSR